MSSKEYIKNEGHHYDKKEEHKENKMANLPTDSDQIDTDPNPGSASSGKQVTSALGRQRTQVSHSKTFVTGTDDDGQVS